MKPETARFVRFLATGGLNTAVGYLSYAALVLTGMPLWLAVAGSAVCSLAFNFYSYGGLVFGNTSPRIVPRFLLFYAAIYFLNYVLLYALTALGLGPLLAQALLVPLIAVLGFAGMRLFVFAASTEKAS